MLARRDEVGESVLLVEELTVRVPAIALVLAAANMGDGVDEASIGERERADGKTRRDGDAIGAVAVEQAWRTAIEGRVLVV